MTPNDNRPRGNMVTDIQNVQAFTNQQLYTKGFQFNVQAGVNEFTPVLGGKARFLYGICVYSELANANDLDNLSLTINSELIIDKAIWNSYNPQQLSGNSAKPKQFFDLPRFLSGSDSVLFNWASINAHKINIVFYLSDVRPVTK